MKIKDNQIREDETLEMLEGIVMLFKGGDPEEYEANEHCVGMSASCKGFVVKDQKGSNFNCTKYRHRNKVLVVKAALFCSKCQKYRNDFYYDATK